MKRLYLTLGILGALLVGSLVNAYCLHQVVNQLTTLLEQAQDLAQQQSYHAAADKVQQAQTVWEENMFYLDVILSHEETDPVEVDFQEALARLTSGNGEEYAAIGARLLREVTLLWETERPVLANIL